MCIEGEEKLLLRFSDLYTRSVFGVLSIYNIGLPTTYACNVAIYATFRYTLYVACPVR